MQQPNILLIFTDQQRWDTMAAYGNSIIHTPNLDRLAKNSVIFENAITPSPLCAPARACTVFGEQAGKIGCLTNSGPKHIDYSHALPTRLGNCGYFTQAIGKMHFSNKPYEESYGMHHMILSEEMRGVRLAKEKSQIVFDDYDRYLMDNHAWGWEKPTEIGYNEIKPTQNHLPKELHITQWCGDETVRWLNECRPKEQPFFLWTSFVKPHVPYDCPQHLKEMYRWQDMEAPWTSDEDGIHKNPAYHFMIEDNEFDLYSEKAAKMMLSHYYANITFIDEQIGRILDTLETLGIYEETLIVFTSDHGDLMGDHGLWYKKVGYEGSLHIPMLLSWPSKIRPKRIKEVVSLLDLYPTFLSVAGEENLEVCAKKPGRNLLKIIEQEVVPGDSENFCVSEMGFPPNMMLHARSIQYKYLFHQNGGYEELYDLSNDPRELKDLADEKMSEPILKEFRQKLAQWTKSYSRPEYVLDEQGNLRIEKAEIEDRWNSELPFSGMPWDLRCPPKMSKQPLNWFWNSKIYDWSSIVQKVTDV